MTRPAKMKLYESIIPNYDVKVVGPEAEVLRYLAHRPPVVSEQPRPTFPNNPTWEQKCRAAWDDVKRLETERQANAKQIHDFNIRLGINDTNERRIKDAEALIRSNEQVARETRDRVAASFATEIAERNKRLGEMEEKLAQAEVRIEELESAGTDAGTGVYIEDEVEALTDVIRAAKAIRKRWRGSITE